MIYVFIARVTPSQHGVFVIGGDDIRGSFRQNHEGPFHLTGGQILDFNEKRI